MENQDQKDIINNYLTHNKATWDAWTDINWNSAFYDNETFLKTKDSLKDIEKDLIGDVTDLSISTFNAIMGKTAFPSHNGEHR